MIEFLHFDILTQNLTDEYDSWHDDYEMLKSDFDTGLYSGLLHCQFVTVTEPRTGLIGQLSTDLVKPAVF